MFACIWDQQCISTCMPVHVCKCRGLHDQPCAGGSVVSCPPLKVELAAVWDTITCDLDGNGCTSAHTKTKILQHHPSQNEALCFFMTKPISHHEMFNCQGTGMLQPPSCSSELQRIGLLQPPSGSSELQGTGMLQPPSGSSELQGTGMLQPPSGSSELQGIGLLQPPSGSSELQGIGLLQPPSGSSELQGTGMLQPPSGSSELQGTGMLQPPSGSSEPKLPTSTPLACYQTCSHVALYGFDEMIHCHTT